MMWRFFPALGFVLPVVCCYATEEAIGVANQETTSMPVVQSLINDKEQQQLFNFFSLRTHMTCLRIEKDMAWLRSLVKACGLPDLPTEESLPTVYTEDYCDKFFKTEQIDFSEFVGSSGKTVNFLTKKILQGYKEYTELSSELDRLFEQNPSLTYTEQYTKDSLTLDENSGLITEKDDTPLKQTNLINSTGLNSPEANEQQLLFDFFSMRARIISYRLSLDASWFRSVTKSRELPDALILSEPLSNKWPESKLE